VKIAANCSKISANQRVWNFIEHAVILAMSFSLCVQLNLNVRVYVSVYILICVQWRCNISKLPNFHRLLGRSSCPKPPSQFSISCLVILSSLLILLLFGPNNAVRNIRTIRTVNPTKYIIFLSCLTPHILLNITQVLRVQYCRF